MMVKRVAGAIGAELKAVNLADGIDAELASTLRALLNEHEVLFLRDQAIEPAAQKALAEIFGPLQTHPAYNTVEGLPEVRMSCAYKTCQNDTTCQNNTHGMSKACLRSARDTPMSTQYILLGTQYIPLGLPEVRSRHAYEYTVSTTRHAVYTTRHA